MSNFHNAVFTGASSDRDGLLARVAPTLARHGISFSGSIRGLNWNVFWDEFEPNPDQEVDALADLFDAFAASGSWQCVCADLRMRQWDIEMYIFDRGDAVPAQGFALALPDSWFRAAAREPSLSAAWRALGLDLAVAGGCGPFLCGTSMPLRPFDAAALERRLAADVSVASGHPGDLHSGALPEDAVSASLADLLRRAGFAIDAGPTAGVRYFSRLAAAGDTSAAAPS